VRVAHVFMARTFLALDYLVFGADYLNRRHTADTSCKLERLLSSL
jgi:hypothetical protein